MPKICAVESCTAPAVARGLCRHHYGQAYYRGTLPPKKELPAVPVEECIIDDRTARIPLWGKGGVIKAWALVDREDFSYLNKWRWKLVANRYAARNTRCGMVYMHRLIIGLKSGDRREVDHINLDTLDNRKSNLRVVTHSQNGQNLPSRTGRVRGVYWVEKLRKWRVKAYLRGQYFHIGLFTNYDDAAKAAINWRRRYMPYATN